MCNYICLTIFRSEIFRYGIAQGLVQDEDIKALICDVIFVNVVEKLKGSAMTLERKEIR